MGTYRDIAGTNTRTLYRQSKIKVAAIHRDHDYYQPYYNYFDLSQSDRELYETKYNEDVLRGSFYKDFLIEKI